MYFCDLFCVAHRFPFKTGLKSAYFKAERRSRWPWRRRPGSASPSPWAPSARSRGPAALARCAPARKASENHENPWKINEKPMENGWKSMKNPWKIHEKSMENRWKTHKTDGSMSFVDSKVGAISSEKPSPMEGIEPLFRSIKGDWNMLSMKSHHILSSSFWRETRLKMYRYTYNIY